MSGALPLADDDTHMGASREPMSIRVRLVRLTKGDAKKVLEVFREYTGPVAEDNWNEGTSVGALGPDTEFSISRYVRGL